MVILLYSQTVFMALKNGDLNKNELNTLTIIPVQNGKNKRALQFLIKIEKESVRYRSAFTTEKIR